MMKVISYNVDEPSRIRLIIRVIMLMNLAE